MINSVSRTAALNTRGYAAVTSVFCASPGNCVAGGNYTNSAGVWRPFVVAQVSGIWRAATAVPGIAVLVHGGATIESVSCAPHDSGSAGGYYANAPSAQLQPSSSARASREAKWHGPHPGPLAPPPYGFGS